MPTRASPQSHPAVSHGLLPYGLAVGGPPGRKQPPEPLRYSAHAMLGTWGPAVGAGPGSPCALCAHAHEGLYTHGRRLLRGAPAPRQPPAHDAARAGARRELTMLGPISAGLLGRQALLGAAAPGTRGCAGMRPLERRSGAWALQAPALRFTQRPHASVPLNLRGGRGALQLRARPPAAPGRLQRHGRAAQAEEAPALHAHARRRLHLRGVGQDYLGYGALWPYTERAGVRGQGRSIRRRPFADT